MIKNTRLFAICGGFYVCTPKWNRERATHKFQNTFDFILPLAGCATYETVGGVTDVTPGHVYFVPGCHMVRWTCSGEMPMYWAATMPESFYLRRRLEGERTLHEWPLAAAPSVEAVFRRFPEFFEEEKLYNDEQRTAKDSRPRQDPPTALGMKIEATLTFLAGDLIEATEKDFRWDNLASLERLRPAIDYMDSNFLRNPPLAEIAKHVGLAPDYLLRLFKKETGVTPHAYMLEQRLARARQLLTGTLQSVKEVALALGYDDPFYFSRQFMKAYGVSPKAFREQGSGLTQ